MTICYRGFVNTWDIDEMGHMNVQHYVERFHQAFEFLAATQAGLPALRLADMTINFVQELRLASQMQVETAIVEVGARTMVLHHHMTNCESGETAATCIQTIDADGALDDALAKPSPFDPAIMRTPKAHFEGGAPCMDRADALGMFDTTRQIVRPADCGPDGQLLPRYVMARYSDGAAHMWHQIGILRDINETGIGSAVVQIYLRFVGAARAGDPMVVRSGAWSIGNKSVSFANWLLNAATGEPIAISESTAVAFDTKARKAISFSDAQRTGIIERLIGK